MKKQLQTWGMVLVVMVIMCGCTSISVLVSKPFDRAQTEVIGMSKADLLCCAGEPMRSSAKGDTEFLTYRRSFGRVSTGSFWKPFSFGTVDIYCDVTFILQDGVVKNITYNPYNCNKRHCKEIIERCLKNKGVIH